MSVMRGYASRPLARRLRRIGEHAPVPTVRLIPVTGFPRNQRGRDHDAGVADHEAAHAVQKGVHLPGVVHLATKFAVSHGDRVPFLSHVDADENLCAIRNSSSTPSNPRRRSVKRATSAQRTYGLTATRQCSPERTAQSLWRKRHAPRAAASTGRSSLHRCSTTLAPGSNVLTENRAFSPAGYRRRRSHSEYPLASASDLKDSLKVRSNASHARCARRSLLEEYARGEDR